MAKTAKLQPIEKKRLIKDVRVNLKRLSRRTIDRNLNPSIITYDITAKISKNLMKLNETTIKATDNTFNIDIKMNAERIFFEPSVVVVKKPVSNRILRPRATIAPIPLSKKLKNDSKSGLIVAKPQSKPTYKMVDDAWRQCKSDSNQAGNTVRINDIVMAKVKGYAPWPATTIEFINKTKVLVKFFGADIKEEFGYVNIAEITPFMSSMNLIRTILVNMKKDILKFTKGVQEAELIYGVPSYASTINM